MVPSVSRVIHRATFTARLALPPTHTNFPHTALLHAICAVAARFSAAVYTAPVEEVVLTTDRALAGLTTRKSGSSTEDDIAEIKCFAERNARYALIEIRADESKGDKLFEILQAEVSGPSCRQCVERVLLMRL